MKKPSLDSSVLAAAVITGLLLTILAAPEADARAFRLNQLPNGTAFDCSICHTEKLGNSPRNIFGQDVEARLIDDGSAVSARKVDWAKVAQLDSDGDGFSNGAELGDPDGTWVVGDPSPDGEITDPARSDDFPEPFEEPDDDDDDGCAVTSTAPRGTSKVPWFLLLLGAVVAARRRR